MKGKKNKMKYTASEKTRCVGKRERKKKEKEEKKKHENLGVADCIY